MSVEPLAAYFREAASWDEDRVAHANLSARGAPGLRLARVGSVPWSVRALSLC